MLPMNLFFKPSLFLCFILSTVYCQNVSPFKGLTVLRAPFVEQAPDGKLSGYFVDLLDVLAWIGKFNYTLEHLNLPTSVPRLYEHTPQGLINNLYRYHADFAISDFLFQTSPRYVDFTEPYLVSGLSALVRKSELTARNINTIEDLLEWKQTDGSKLEEISLGTVRSSIPYRMLSLANDKIGRRVYELMLGSRDLADSRDDGIGRVLNSSYALVQETFNNELVMDEHCELTQLLLRPNSADASKKSVQLELAIAVQKGGRNNILHSLNDAINVLKASGQLEQLRQRYWNRTCNSVPSSGSGIISPDTLPIMILIMLFCQMVLH